MKLRKWYLICVTVMLCLQIFTMIYFGGQKQNFHVDEYFSYYSANDNDFYIGLQDRVWNKSDITIEKCEVHIGERFNYKNVYDMETRDVHPPLYYYCLHTICSFFPETFSKWFGLGLNIVFFAISFFILERITWWLSGGNEKLTLAVNLFYGFNPAIISAVMFIRMYMLLVLFVLLFVYIHLHIAREEYRVSVKGIVAVAVVSFGGFLTHYYFIVFAGMFSVVFAVCTYWKSRKIKNSLWSFGAFLAGTGSAVWYYPACIEHIFFGYRGTGAQEAFFDMSNTLYRLRYFSHLTSRIAFADWFKEIVILELALVLAAVIIAKKKKAGYSFILSDVWVAIVLTTLGYYALIVKTALINEDEMVRYTFPIYGFLFLIMLSGFMFVIKSLIASEKVRTIAWGILMLGGFALNLYGMARGSVLFLYPEQEERESFVSNYNNAAVIQVHGNEGWTWEIAKELQQTPEFYCISVDDLSEIEDDRIEEAQEIIAYIDHGDVRLAQQSIQLILNANEKISGYEKCFETIFYDVYLFQ